VPRPETTRRNGTEFGPRKATLWGRAIKEPQKRTVYIFWNRTSGNRCTLCWLENIKSQSFLVNAVHQSNLNIIYDKNSHTLAVHPKPRNI
jgi:hypothetical protein